MILAAVFLAGLVISAMTAGKLAHGDVMLITPIASNTSALSAERLEEINGDHFLLTYEILSQKNIRAMNSNYDVTLRKTNYAYRSITNFRMLSGTFLTEADQNNKRRSAVLNKAAALAMYGNLDVCGRELIMDQEQYTIVGVMEDKDDKAKKAAGEEALHNVYIPASVSGENPVSFAVQLKDGMSAGMAKNEVKGLTIQENGYAYIRFGTLTDLVYGMFFISLKSVLIAASLILIRTGSGRLRSGINQIKNLKEHLYLTEIFRLHTRLLMKTAVIAVTMALAAVLILNIVFRFFGYFQLWSGVMPFAQYGAPSVFREIAAALGNNIYFSVFLLIGFLLNMVFFFISSKNP